MKDSGTNDHRKQNGDRDVLVEVAPRETLHSQATQQHRCKVHGHTDINQHFRHNAESVRQRLILRFACRRLRRRLPRVSDTIGGSSITSTGGYQLALRNLALSFSGRDTTAVVGNGYNKGHKIKGEGREVRPVRKLRQCLIDEHVLGSKMWN